MSNLYDLELSSRAKLLLDRNNVFVMAGAGAGKSTSLVNRIIGFLELGEDPACFVVISFTNKASEELRQKIINKLDERIKEEKDQTKLDNLVNALNHIDLMHVSTIHKFCSDILKENSIYASLSPDFKIIVDEEEEARKQLVFNGFVRKLNKDDFESLGLGLIASYNIKRDLQATYDVLCSHIDRLEYDHIYNANKVIDISGKDIKDDFYKFRSYILNIEHDILELANLFKDSYLGLSDIYKAGAYDKYHLRYNDNRIVSFKYECPFNGNLFRKKEVKEDYSEYKAKIEELADIFTQRKELFKQRYSILITKYAYQIYLSYLDYIDQDHDNISNDQSIYLAYKLLKENKDIRLKLKKHYKHIYIDEYQDTDHLQRDIALLLTRSEDKFDDDSLYLVGDPKQSIYRFRGAEPDVYFDTMKLFKEANTSKYDLNINFRSNDKILDYVNTNFKYVRLTDEDYLDMLVASKNIIKDEDYNDNDKLIGFYQFRNTEEGEIAKLVKYLVKNKLVRDSGVYRPLKYKDIMIIARNHRDMIKYVSAFTQEGIPSKVSGESDFSVDMATRSFVSLFSAISSNSEKCFEEASSVFKNNYPDKFNNLSANEEKELLNDLFLEIKNKTCEMSSYGKALYLINHLEWIIKENTRVDYFIINSIKSKLHQMVEEIFSSDYLNGNELASRFKEYITSTIEYESLIDDNADCVEFINIHKAKGLESKVVIWLAVDKIKKTNHPNTSFKDGILYLNASAKKTSQSDQPNNIDLYDDMASEAIFIDEAHELARLEYVAATRPKEAFIFAHNNSKGLFFREDVYDINDLREIEVTDLEEDERRDAKLYEAREVSYSDEDSLIKYISPSSLELFSHTRHLEHLKHQDEQIISNRPQSNIIGSVMHKAFELLVKNKGNNLDLAVKKAVDEYASMIDDYDSVYNFIYACTKALEEYYRLNNIYDCELYPELNYSYLKSDNLISNGSIDLLIKDKDHYLVIDYKSDEAVYINEDRVFEKTLLEKYKTQIDEYIVSLKNMGIGLGKIDAMIIYFRRYDRDNKRIDLKTLKI